MVRQDKSRSGRVTPRTDGSSGVSRVPVKVESRFSQLIPILMLGCMGLGTAIILANYVVIGFGAPSNWYLLGGLGLILVGIVAATQWR